MKTSENIIYNRLKQRYFISLDFIGVSSSRLKVRKKIAVNTHNNCRFSKETNYTHGNKLKMQNILSGFTEKSLEYLIMPPNVL